MEYLYHLLIEPFAGYGFMRRALVATIALGVGAGPVGVLLVLRRMSLFGEAMCHGLLPGAAVGFLIAGGLSLTAMGLGGMAAGLIVALLSGVVTRATVLKEDASLASLYITFLALGVLIISLRGSNVDLLHVLFGTILTVDVDALYWITGIATLTLAALAVIYRPLVVETFDPAFLKRVGRGGSFYHFSFLFLVVINLVSGFQVLGTLMSVGMMMLPAIIAQLWNCSLPIMFVIAAVSAAVSGYVGLVASYHWGLPSGPAIVLTASVLYLFSLLFGPSGIRQHGKFFAETLDRVATLLSGSR